MKRSFSAKPPIKNNINVNNVQLNQINENNEDEI